jgi:hypothetical protein
MRVVPSRSLSGTTEGVELVRGVAVELSDGVAQHLIDAGLARLEGTPDPDDVDDEETDASGEEDSDSSTDADQDGASTSGWRGRRRP